MAENRDRGRGGPRGGRPDDRREDRLRQRRDAPTPRAPRHALAELVNELGPPDHAGLAHDVYAPFCRPGGDDPGSLEAWSRWFKHLASIPVPAGYHEAFARWKACLEADTERTTCMVLKAQGRLLIGHGNPSPTEVGLTLQRTWGTPLLPGSTLKGVTASYSEVVYGPDPADDADPARAAYRGLRREGTRVVHGPGEVLRRLFGAPPIDGPAGARTGEDLGAMRGEVIFHDAWWIPEPGSIPLLRDVLTVHHGSYYQNGKWPNDYDEPIPVSFITVRPGARFLAALTWAPQGGASEALGREVLERARLHLEEALAEWGAGGKTAAGYGRLSVDRPSPTQDKTAAGTSHSRRK